MALPEGLLTSVRNYLDITWADPEGDKKLEGIISRGISKIDSIAGAELDYTQENVERALLFDYCRYVRSGALDDFETNYQSELIGLQNREAVKAYEAEQADTDV